MKRFLALILSLSMILSCFGTVSFASEATSEFVIDSLEEYVVYTGALADDGYIGVPVGIKTYVKGTTTSATPMIIYVVNTNTPRVGTDSDESIITDFLDRGYAVVVLDYYNNPATTTPDIDWSVQEIKTSIRTGVGNVYLAGNAASTTYVYILPAGYSLTRQLEYWALDKHGYSGTFEFIMSVWNNDFLGVWGDKGIITFAEDTDVIKGAGESEYLSFNAGDSLSVREYTAMLTGGVVTDISQCIKRDGKPIDMNLYMDIVYPTHPANEVPVLMYAQSSQDTVGTWNTPERPHMSGFLFRGYAGVLFDYAYVPMSRNDNWGYFDGDGSGSVGGVTGDNYTYSVGMPSGVKNDTAAVRLTRWLADQYPDTYKFDLDKFGAIGISKSGPAIRLGHPDPESLPEMRHFEDEGGKTRYEKGDTEDIVDSEGNVLVYGGQPQPWLTYKDGTKIPANVQFTSTNVGSGQYSVVEGDAPMYIYGTMAEGGSMYNYYPDVLSRCYTHDVPTMNYVCQEVGHSLCYGPDLETGNDTYEAMFAMSDYWLKDAAARCEYIKPLDGSNGVEATDKISIKFNAPVAESEIAKVTITNNTTGEQARGEWKASYGRTLWEFEPYNLKGGYVYTVNVPATVAADNGKAIEAKSASFTVKPEKLVSATMTGESMTATAADGVYFEVEGADIKTSTTTAIRFGVKNDAANNVLVYSADENGEAVDLLGKINLNGAGEYDLDVTEYADSLAEGEKARFVLKAEKTAGTNEIFIFDAEGISALPGSVTTGVAYEISNDVNATEGGASSFKMTAAYPITRFAPYHTYYGGQNAVLNISALGSSLSDGDFGRKFNVSMKIYDTTSRVVNIDVGNYTNNVIIDGTTPRYSYQTAADAWNDYSFDFRAEGDLYNTRYNVNLSAETHGADTGLTPLYVDDIKVSEYITDVEIASESDGVYCAPSLVLHPADARTVLVDNASYVESGKNADVSFENENSLLVSGRSKALDDGTNKKVYAKVDLSGINPAYRSVVSIEVKNGTRGDISVYGIEEEINIEETNVTNAYANDRFGAGVDTSKVFEGAPLDTVDVAGNGIYSFDIHDYASYMQDAGKNYGYLIFVCDTEENSPIYEEDVSDGKLNVSVWKGGSVATPTVSSAEDYENNGYSLKINPLYSYDRVYFDFLDASTITEADIGRKFTMTYQFKADMAGFIVNNMQKYGSDNDRAAIVYQIYETANTWQKFTYEFTLTETMYNTASLYPAFRFEGLAGATVYVDNIQIHDASVGNISFDFVEGNISGHRKTFDFENVSAWNVNNNASEVSSSYDMGMSGWTLGTTTATISGAQNNTSGGSKSLRLFSDVTWNRFKFFNMFDHVLTEADLGRTFNVSFWAKSSKAGTFNYGMMSLNNAKDSAGTYLTGYGDRFYSDADNVAAGASIEKDVWTKYTYSIKINEKMLASYYAEDYPDSSNLHPAWFSIVPSGLGQTTGDEVELFIDDLKIVETTVNIDSETAPYTLTYGWEGEAPAGFTMAAQGFSNNASSKATTSASENHTTNGSVSLRIISDYSWNRLFLGGLADSFTQADIGRSFKAGFWAKADKAGSFDISIASTALQTGGYTGMPYQVVTFSESEVNTWKLVKFDFTISQEVVSAGANMLRFMISGFGSDPTDYVTGVNIYIDDIYSYEVVEGNYKNLTVTESKTISNGKQDGNVVNRANSANEVLQGIAKTYLKLVGSEEYADTQRATLHINVEEANGQTIKIYEIINSQYPQSLTYNSAPATNNDESMNGAFVRGAAPVAELVLDGAGEYTVDVTDYIKDNAPNDYIFAITSEDFGGNEYVNIDFESYDLTNGVDYISSADIDTTSGKAYVASNAIKLYNVFGNGGKTVTAGEKYTVSFDLVSPVATEFKVSVDGDSDEIYAYAPETYNVAAGESQKIVYEYTATAEDVTNGINSLNILSDDLLVAAFEIDNVRVANEKKIVLSKDASIVVETAKAPDPIDPTPTPDPIDPTPTPDPEPDVKQVDLSVVVNGAGSVTDADGNEYAGTKKSYDVGTEFELTATAEEGYSFAYWLDEDSSRILSFENMLKVVLVTGKNISAVFVSEDENIKTVIFRNKNNQIVSKENVSEGESVTVPSNPVYMGYVFAGWTKDSVLTQLKANDTISYDELDSAVNTYVATYERGSGKYLLNLVNATVSPASDDNRYAYDSKLTLSGNAQEGYFSHWLKDEKIASYDESYTFYMGAADTTVEAVYVDDESLKEEKAPVIIMSDAVVLTGENRIAFFAERNLYDSEENGREFIESGILVDVNGGTGEFGFDEGILKAVSTSKSGKGQFVIRKAGLDEGDAVRARAYMIYKENGEIKTAFSNITEGIYN